MYRNHLGQGHYWCQNCGHAVRSQYGGCRTCMTPLSDLVLFDEFAGGGGFDNWGGGGIGFDPVDDSIAFNIPGTDLAIEPDGQVDVGFGGMDFPI